MIFRFKKYLEFNINYIFFSPVIRGFAFFKKKGSWSFDQKGYVTKQGGVRSE